MQAASKLHLPQVTALAVDCVNYPLISRAWQIQEARVNFASHAVLSDQALDVPHHLIAPISSRQAYSAFVLKQLLPYVQTPFVLLYQWDGYVLNPSAWRDDFLDYDYIGATWWYADGRNVGNGGFSLRSRKLLLALQDPRIPAQVLFEDDMLCRSSVRDVLEGEYGIRFAPDALANGFAFEHNQQPHLTLGFHGFFNFHRLYADSEVVQVLELGGQRLLRGRDCAMLVCHALREGRLALSRYIYESVQQAHASEEFAAHLRGYAHDAAEQLAWLNAQSQRT